MLRTDFADIAARLIISFKYINNLPPTEFGLYSGLETLFAAFVPMFENVYSYFSAVKFHPKIDDDNCDDWLEVPKVYKPELEAASLRGKNLRVVVKIVEYELGDSDTFDGVWHVEGMSHESSTFA
jgi:hypothetical protein